MHKAESVLENKIKILREFKRQTAKKARPGIN